MSYTPEQIISTDDWSADRIESVRAAMQGDARLESAVRRWMAVTSAVGAELRSDLPPSEALVSYALRETEHADEMSGQAHADLDEASRILDSAIENHPAVQYILDRIREDADDFARCWDEAMIERAAEQDRKPVPSRSRLRLVSPRWISAAAAVVVLAVSTMLLFDPDPAARDDRTVWTADAGTYLPVELPDGTDLRLAGPATLSFDEDSPRTVELAGSAFFDVTPAETRFSITTSTATVEVLGTSFGVLSDERSTEVTLVTGSLRLASPDGRSVHLEPGQRSRVVESDGPDAPVRVDVTDVLRWTGLFVFRDTPLKDVARTLGEEYDIHIDVSEELRDETLTGTFAEEQGVVEILRVISAAMSADLDVSEDRTRFALRR